MSEICEIRAIGRDIRANQTHYEVTGHLHLSTCPVRIVIPFHVATGFQRKFKISMLNCEFYIRTNDEYVIPNGKRVKDVQFVGLPTNHLTYSIADINEIFLKPLPRLGYTLQRIFSGHTEQSFSASDVVTDLLSFLVDAKDFQTTDNDRKQEIQIIIDETIEKLKQIP